MPEVQQDLEARLIAHLRADPQARPGLAQRILARQRALPRRRWWVLPPAGVALLAPVAVAVALVAVFAARPSPPVKHPQPVASPPGLVAASPSPSSGPYRTVAPPAGVDILYYNQPGDCRRLIAVDWTGRVRGEVALDQAIGFYGQPYSDCGGYQTIQNPDGSLLFLPLGLSDHGTSVLDPRTGVRQPTHEVGPSRSNFSDDSKHFCRVEGTRPVEDSPVPANLFIADLTHFAVPAKNLGAVGQMGPQSGPYLEGCSNRTNRAIVGQSGVMRLVGYSLVNLSTGKIIADRKYAPFPGDMVVSAGMDRIAIVDATGATPTRVARTSDDATVASWSSRNGERRPVAFSSDGRLLLTQTTTSADGRSELLELLDLGSQVAGKPRVVWHQDVIGYVRHVLPRVNSEDIAIAISDPLCQGGTAPVASPCTDPSDEGRLLVLHGDGTTTPIADRAQPGW